MKYYTSSDGVGHACSPVELIDLGDNYTEVTEEQYLQFANQGAVNMNDQLQAAANQKMQDKESALAALSSATGLDIDAIKALTG